MSKGFLIYAQNTNSTNYIDQAYTLALSIKLSQHSINSVSLVTNDSVPDKYLTAFDHIIKIPWVKNVASTRYCGEHRWKLYHITPYEETIVLDADMIVLEDINSWWEYCRNFDIKFCSKIRNYKLEKIEDSINRRAFLSNNLYNPYFGLHYFKKSNFSHKFYKVLEFVCNNWEWCWGTIAPNNYQNWLSMDLAAAVAIEITGNDQLIIDVNAPLEFIHMKTNLQGWELIPEHWTDACSYIFNSNGELIINNIKQSKIFHYVDSRFLKNSMQAQLEKLVYG